MFNFINQFFCSYPCNYGRHCHYQGELCRQFRDITTGFEVYNTKTFKITQRYDINLCPVPVILILQTCNLWETSNNNILLYTFRPAKKI